MAMNYFPHDFNARNDVRIVRLRMELGNKGVGVYWSIVEMLYEAGGKMKIADLNTVAFAINEEQAIVQKVVQQYDLFKFDDKFFWNDTITERLKAIKKITASRSAAGKASGRRRLENKDKKADNQEYIENKNAQQNNNTCSTNAEQVFNRCSTSAEHEEEQTPNNIKEIKRKEIKENNKEDIVLSPAETGDGGGSVRYKEILDYYNRACSSCNLVRCVKLTDRRKDAIRARVKEFGLRHVFRAIDIASQSAFMNGHNDRNWKADFDFVFNANKMARILENKYTDNNDNERDATGARRQYEDGNTAFSRIMSRISARQNGETEKNHGGFFGGQTDGNLQG